MFAAKMDGDHAIADYDEAIRTLKVLAIAALRMTAGEQLECPTLLRRGSRRRNRHP